jgi:hypothetical protein
MPKLLEARIDDLTFEVRIAKPEQRSEIKSPWLTITTGPVEIHVWKIDAGTVEVFRQLAEAMERGLEQYAETR